MRGGGGEGWVGEALSESFNKRNIHEKVLFEIVLNEVLESCKKRHLLM